MDASLKRHLQQLEESLLDTSIRHSRDDLVLVLKQASAEWILGRLTAGFGTRRAVAVAHVEPVKIFALPLLYWLAFLAC